MPLGMELDLGPGHIVLDGTLSPPLKGTQQPRFRPMSTVAKRSPISATVEQLCCNQFSGYGDIVMY